MAEVTKPVLKLRRMAAKDEPVVVGLIVAGAKAGHFAAEYASERYARDYIRAFMRGAVCIKHFEDMRGTASLVFSLRNQLDGFLTAMDWEAGSSETDIELHMASVVPSRRRRGIAQGMIDWFVFEYPLDVNFWARCRPASSAMRHTLLKIGFELVSETHGTSTLCLSHTRRLEISKSRQAPQPT